MAKANGLIHVDVLIVGAGPVGGSLALSLRDSGASVAVVEARLQPADDGRALALAEGSRQTLARLDLWPAEAATAVHRVHVSQQGSLGRVRLDRTDLGLAALGYVAALYGFGASSR